MPPIFIVAAMLLYAAFGGALARILNNSFPHNHWAIALLGFGWLFGCV
jgi:hypothetical protein